MVAQNNILKLIHARIGKHQCGVVFDYHGCGRHDEVTFRLKKTFERFSNFVCGQHIFSYQVNILKNDLQRYAILLFLP
jgi:hypothetical protein